jgi:hypothetical protein
MATEYCQCHHERVSKHPNDGHCTGEHYGPCTCQKFRPLETGHFVGDGCAVNHGTIKNIPIPLSIIRAKFQKSLELVDFGIPQDYGGSRWHPSHDAFECQMWLEKNARAVLYSLLYPED